MMKRILLAAALGAASTVAMADVGVSINVGQPGFYGQIDLGNAPPPAVVYQQPVVVQQDPQYVGQPPIYLHVQPGYERHWRRHCAQYNACGRQVYFVQHSWYNYVYVPQYHNHPEYYGHGGPGPDRHDDRRDDHHDDRRGDHDHDHN